MESKKDGSCAIQKPSLSRLISFFSLSLTWGTILDLKLSFLPQSIVWRELLEGKVMQPHFNLFELPTVSTFILVKKKDDLENLFTEQISKYYFG